MSITITHQTISIDVNNSVPQQVQCIANVNDSGTRYVDVTLYANGSTLTISSSCTATATFVTDGVLVSDEVECTISNSVITVPLQDFSSISGMMLCEINITYDEEVIVTPFAFIVRVTPTLASNAQISNKSYGTTAEILQEVAEARGDYDSLSESISTKLATKEDTTNKCAVIYSSDTTDSDTTNKYKAQYPTVDAVRNYVANQIAATLVSEDLKVDLSGIESNLSTIFDSLEDKEDLLNKVTAISSDNSASEEYYPSAGAVVKYVNSSLNKFENSWDFESLCNDVDTLAAQISEKASKSDIDTAIKNFENSWDFESLCKDVDNLSSNVDGLESNINTLTSKVASTNMIYFKQGTSYWDGDIYIFFYNDEAASPNFNNRIFARNYPGDKMILIDEENGIFAYPRLNYTRVIFTSANVDSDSGWNYKTSDLILPWQTQEKMPCFFQSPIGYDGIWGDLVTDTVRIFLQAKYTDISVCLTDTGEYITPYSLGIAGTGVGETVYYSFVDLPSNFESIEITWTVGTGSNDYIVTTHSREILCYNRTVVYCAGSDNIGYFNGELDEFFRELIGYDNSKLS